MKERPIIFNDEMVRAILAGRKTQTRRIVNGVPSSHDFHGWVLSSTSAKDEGKACWAIGKSPLLNKPIRVRCPFGAIGDRLWVRETFGDCGVRFVYRADTDDGAACQVKRWTPSIHMPRWASRITLEITDVRVERLQNITEDDARTEGVINGGCLSCGEPEPCGCDAPDPSAIEGFAHLWR
ncbi:hypothetical protein, partial [Edwardsiella tarda]|uniref:hypothetical protein n=1 Tax=Edwardsiella tarda TaxID=636 RepID=UPI0006829FB7